MKLACQTVYSKSTPRSCCQERPQQKTLVENLTTEKFDLGQYSDRYAKELEKIIEAKSKGQTIKEQEEEPKEEKTTDVLEALKASLKVKGKSSTTVAKAKGKMGMATAESKQYEIIEARIEQLPTSPH